MKKLFALAVTTLAATVSLNASAAGNVAAGKAAAEKFNCAACHGKDYTTPIDPSYPKLAGQHKDYLEHSLLGNQQNTDNPNGRGNAFMGGLAKLLSHQDVQNISAYLSSLPGSLVLRK